MKTEGDYTNLKRVGVNLSNLPSCPQLSLYRHYSFQNVSSLQLSKYKSTFFVLKSSVTPTALVSLIQTEISVLVFTGKNVTRGN